MTAATPTSDRATLLRVRQVTKSYGGLRALDGVDLDIQAGEMRCIIGPNGAGKSTLFKLLVGVERPSAGVIDYDGRTINRLHPHQRAHLGIGVKFQTIDVYPSLTVAQNLMLPLQHAFSGGEISAEVERLLAKLGMAADHGLSAGHLPHGKKQWLALGMALAMRPRLLLLDEPTAGMGPEETRETAQLVRDVNGEGVAVIVVEHDMAFVRWLAAPITVLHLGKVFASGSLGEIERHADVRRIYLGRTSLDTDADAGSQRPN